MVHCHDIGQHIGAYGVETVRTPNLDRFADESVLFENSFCTSPGCSPSRAALFTGRYPHTTGVIGLAHMTFRFRLNDDEQHLAQILRGEGYRTGLVSVQHEHPTSDRLGYQTHVRKPNARETAQEAERTLTEYAKSDEPFFLSVGFEEPHRTVDGDFLLDGIKPDRDKGVFIPPYIPTETDEEQKAAEKEFAELQGAINEADKGIGTVLDAARKLGLMENTIVIYTADHGIAMPRAKCTLYDAGIEVPLIIHAPASFGLPHGTRLQGLVSTVDVVPTLLEALAITPPNPLEGISFLSYMQGGDEHRDFIFAEKNYHDDYDPIRCIRTKTHKYIMNFEHQHTYRAPGDIMRGDIFRTALHRYVGFRDERELFDIQKDKWELNNLAEKDEYHDVERELRGRLLAFMKETNDPLLSGTPQSAYNKEYMATWLS